MKRRAFLASTTALTAPGLAGCGGGNGGDQTGGGGEQGDGGGAEETNLIIVKNDSYIPNKAAVAPGEEVRWNSQEGYEHTVTAAQFHEEAASWSFDETLASAGTLAHTFEEAGIYEYYCTIHGKGTMCGAILVGDVSLDKPLPCE